MYLVFVVHLIGKKIHLARTRIQGNIIIIITIIITVYNVILT